MGKIEKIKADINRLQETTMDENRNFLSSYHEGIFDGLSMIDNFIDSLEEEPVSEDLHAVAKEYADNITDKIGYRLQLRRAVCYGAQWQKEQDQSTIELAEDHAYLAGQEKIIEKACEWLEEHLLDFWTQKIVNTDYFIEEFKKAMEK